MKKNLLFIAFCLFATRIYAQPLPDRYRTNTFASSTVVSNVVFSANIPTVSTNNLFGNQIADEVSYGSQITTLRMNIYQPTGDTLTKKPVIIFCFGGGFVTGSKTETSMIQFCQQYALRGFLTATIDYRLGMNISDEALSKRAVYRGIQDGRSAVRFFRNNASTYSIDPNQIYIAGHSAGGFIALHNLFLDKESERPLSTFLYMVTRPDLGTLDAIGDNKTDAGGNPVSGKANACMAFAGALGELSYIENATEPPSLYFHSSDDNVIPYNSGEPFSNLNWLPGFNLPTVYGGNQLNIRAGIVGAARLFYPYTNRGHNVHFQNPNLYSDIASRGSLFFYDQRLKPVQEIINGNTTVCANALTQIYTFNTTVNFYYDWQIIGGTFVARNPYSNTVTLTWDASAPVRSLTCTPYSRQLAQGTAVSIGVSINQLPTASPIGNRLYQISDPTQIINLASFFTDPEGQIMTYSATVNPNGIVSPLVTGNNLALSVQGAGTTTLTVIATDPATCSVSQTFQVSVNRPPVVSQVVSGQTITYGENPFVIADLGAIFTDPDNDPLVYTVSDAPAGIVGISRAGNQVTFAATSIGTTTITLNANDGRGGITSTTFSITVKKGNQLISFDAIGDKYVDELTATLVATSNKGLPVSFSLISGAATLNGNVVSFNSPTSLTIRASQAGNAFFNAAPNVERTFQVVKRNQAISFDAIEDKLLSEGNFEVNATASSNLPVSIQIISGEAIVQNKTITMQKTGYLTLRASQIGNAFYNAAESMERTFYVSPDALQLTLTPNPFSNQIQIILQGKYKGSVQLSLYDMTGKVITERDFEKQNLFYTDLLLLEALPQGTYIFKLVTQEKTFTERLVKQ